MTRNTRQMLISMALVFALAGVLLVGFVGCDYRGPTDADADPPSPLPARAP